MKQFFRENGFWIVVISLMLGFITAVVSYGLYGTANPVSNAIGTITAPIRNSANDFLLWAEGIYNYSFRYQDLLAENERLREENADLSSQIRQGDEAIKENERLREILGLREKRADFVMESATVTAQNSTNWASTLTLSKGSNLGIEVGDCVVDPAGNLVGIIKEVGTNYSIMITIVDANLEIGGYLPRTDSTAIVEGDFSLMQESKLKATYLPENTQYITGDLVLTAGTTGVYPSGLVIGTIASMHVDRSGMVRYAVVEPSANLRDLVQVFIIKDFDIIE